ncbi:uncharacterized protein PEZ65_022130 isoform 2-T2 [Lycodopsis pacificus]
MADGAALVEEGIGPAQSPLVAVSFQRNVHRKEKYLEAEPKALGITQIGLSVFQITCVAVFLSKGLSDEQADIPFFISSLLLIIAGSLAVAARNLHLPTSTNSHFFAEVVVIQAALFAISVTLAAYCCKVVNCCSPAPKMPVITVHVPPVQQ